MSRVTVNVNGLSLVHEDSGGVSTATLPDVCLTPPNLAPAPYPNVAFSRDLTAGSSLVRADGGNRIAVAGSAFGRSVGDEPGSAGGVTSGVSGKEATWLSHSFDVEIEGRGACRLTDKMLHNRGNTLDCWGVHQGKATPGGASKGGGKGKGARAHQHKNHRLEVSVVDAQTKQPVKGARISLRGPEDVAALSGATGKHLFKKLERGRFEVVVTHPWYPDARSPVLVTRAHQARTVKLDPQKLRDVAQKRGVEIGARPNMAPCKPGVIADDSTLVNEFDGMVLGAFWNSRCPNYPGVPANPALYDWSVDWVFNYVGAHPSLWVEGTPLVWAAVKSPTGPLTPPWATAKLQSMTPKKDTKSARAARAKLLRELQTDFIVAVMSHYPQITRWVVCNEMMNLKYNGGIRSSPVWKAFGVYKGEACTAKYNIAEMFRVAHQQNPAAILIINDFDVEGWDGGSSSRGERGRLFYELVRWLVGELAKGPRSVPRKNIAAGFQMHVPETDKAVGRYRQDYRPASIQKQVERFKKLGVKVYVTEIDVEVPGMGQLEKELKKADPHKPPLHEAAFAKKHRRRYEAVYQAQKKRYHDLFRALLDGGNCPSITTWGILDGPTQFRFHGYMMSPYPIFGYAPADGGHYRKPAYFGALTAMHEFVK